jgi:hypothetical protein
MTATLEDSNAALRHAVNERLAASAAGKPSDEWYPQPPANAYTLADFGATPAAAPATAQPHPASQAFYDLCDRMKEMHGKKSFDYGSAHDPLANIRNGATFVGIEPWKGAMVRLSDKVTRLATYNRTGSLHFEGVEDTLLDLASYALLALVLYREEAK